VHLRARPGTQFRILGTVPADSEIGVLGCSNNWCHVKHWRGPEGYISAQFLTPGPPPAVFGFGIRFGDGWYHRRPHHH